VFAQIKALGIECGASIENPNHLAVELLALAYSRH